MTRNRTLVWIAQERKQKSQSAQQTLVPQPAVQSRLIVHEIIKIEKKT